MGYRTDKSVDGQTDTHSDAGSDKTMKLKLASRNKKISYHTEIIIRMIWFKIHGYLFLSVQLPIRYHWFI